MIRIPGNRAAMWCAAAGVTALCGVLLTAPTAHATSPAAALAPLSCGQTVTTSVVLVADLLNCPGDGLIIGSGGITVDLNGHTVDGVGLGTGIRNNGFDNTIITNSSTAPARVEQFDYGTRLDPGSSGNLVEKIIIRNNEFSGVTLHGAGANNRVRGNLIERQSHTGVTLTGGSNSNVIIDNTISFNQGGGVFVQSSADNRFESNRITDSGQAGVVLEASMVNTLLTNTISGSGDGGVVIRLGADHNLLQSNTATRNSDAGVIISGSTGNRLLSNDLRNSGDSGVFLQAAHSSRILGNNVSENTGGIQLSGSDNNLIRSNTANDTTGDGIGLELSLNNAVELNRTDRNGSAGIRITGSAPSGTGNSLVGNIATANKGDGIHVAKNVHTLRANVTRSNGGWGIIADPANVDGGTNKASGNGQAAQCTGVVCTP
ncbi:NosD domain-containing protein [Streptomyces sp. CAU 1734]|uniref:right-handed parallel beta-helix repeat-containing protein n=1 Tax=Streptomyces sp. CAU 1734 TaxID=3140360 RepID=UPI0032612035